MSPPNPYVGPRAFTTGEPLYGRSSERAALLDLLVAERVVLLHSPSGAGKSSLLLAGLIPDLRAEGFVVRPPIRVGTEPPASAGAVNRFCFSAVLSLAEGEAQARPMADLGRSSLASYLGEQPAEAEVLIFDQFEEVLTIDPVDRDSKHAFFADLGAALRCPQRWAVIAIREDHLAGLAPYARALPTRLKTTFHLDLLGVEAALAAVQLPARAAGVAFTDAAARKLVDDLRQVQVQTAEGGTAKVAGPHVEPVQLQVACRDLWERKPADDGTIDEHDVQEIGDVDQALTRYYDAQIAAVAAATAMAEVELRRWFDRALISEQGLRGQVLQGATHTQGLANAAVRRLVDTHLVRAEQRRGIVWFELAHDRLIGPVRASNARWADDHLSTIQRQAQLWDSRGRPESLLMVDLAVIERHLADPGMAALERTFLEHSRVLRQREAEALRLRRIVRVLTVVVLVGLLVTLGTVAVVLQLRGEAETRRREDAEEQQRDAERQREEAEAQRDAAAAAARAAEAMGRAALSRQLAATVLLMPPERAELAALYAVAASQMGAGWDIRGCFGNLMSRAPQLRALVPGVMAPILLAHDPTHGVLAGLERSGRVNLWDLKTRGLIAAPRAGVGHEAVVFDASRGQFVTADRDATVTFYEPTTGTSRSLALETGPWRRVAVSGDGTRLATADAFGRIGVWDANSGATLALTRPPQRSEERRIELLALDASGELLALATEGGEVSTWRWGGGGLVRAAAPGGAEEEVRALPAGLRFGADGGLVALLGDGRVLRWTVTAEGKAETPTRLATLGPGERALSFGEEVRFLGLGLAPDGAGAAALVCTKDCTREALLHWDAASGRVDAVAIALADRTSEARFDLLVTPDVAIGAGTEVAARVWELQRWRPLPGSPGDVSALVVGDGGSRFAAAGCPAGGPDCASSQVTVWRTGERTPVHAGLGGLAEPARGLAFFADDTRLAGFGRDGMVVLWDMSSGTATPAARLPTAPAALAVRARGAELLAAIGSGTAVQVWEVLAGRFVAVDYRGPTLPVRSLAIDGAARLLAAGGCLEAAGPVGARERLGGDEVTACVRGGIYLWDLASGAAVGEPCAAHEEAVVDLTFSPDGARLLSVSANGSVLEHTTAGGLHDERGLEDATIPAQSGAYAPDGAIVTIGCPRLECPQAAVELRLWAGDPLGAVGAPTRQHSPLPREGVNRRRVGFAAGGEQLISASADGVVVRDLSVAGMRRWACRLAGRDLSAADWRRYLRDQPAPAPVCPALQRPDLGE